MMKKLFVNQKIIILLMCLVCSASMLAQNKTEQLKAIRKAYAEAKKEMAENGKKGNPRMDCIVTQNDGTRVSEDFVINDEYELDFFFKRIHLSNETDLFKPSCYFIVEKYYSNGHSIYREMLFEPFSTHLLFSYMKAETHAGYVIESRFYYDDEGRLIEQKHHEGGKETTPNAQSWSTDKGDYKMALEHLQFFNKLMQQKDMAAERITPTDSNADEIKHIRAAYAKAKSKIDQDASADIPRNIQVVVHDQEDPAMPPREDVLKFWFSPIDLGQTTDNKCYFASSTCSMGDHHVYSEYLFDEKDSHLMFCFSKQEQNDGKPLEWRYYFDDKGRCIEAKGQNAQNGPGFAGKATAKLCLDLFNVLTTSH